MTKKVKRFKSKPAKNGLILEGPDGEILVCQEYGGEETELRAWQDFLWEIIDRYAPMTSRYSPLRLRVILEPGDKYEGEAVE